MGQEVGIPGCVVVRTVKRSIEAYLTSVPRSPICVCAFHILAMCVVMSGAAGGECGARGRYFGLCCCARREMFY